MTTAVAAPVDQPLTIGGRQFRSRLMVGTGKYRSNEIMVRALEASGAEIVTVAVRRVDLDRRNEQGILHHLDPQRFFLLANTAGCYSADEAVRYARLAREAGFNDFIKLEVIGDRETLLPDVEGLLQAARTLVAEGFRVMAYTNDDLITALKLADLGGAAGQLLRAVDAGRLFEAARDQALSGLNERDRRLAQEIAAGVLRRRRTLDRELIAVLGPRWRTTDPELRDLLRIGAYRSDEHTS